MLSPTIDYLSDPNYVIVDGVPILDEHELFVPGNKEKGTQDQRIKITPAVLQHICDNNNRRAKETGDVVLLVDGHTKDDAPEDDQPEILGEADSFRLGPLFNTGRQAILSRWKISKDPAKLAKVKGITRRSVELWTDRWEIDPIAILRSTPPERDLGVLRLSRMENRSIDPAGRLRYKLTKHSIAVHYEATPMQPNPMATPQMPAQPPVAAPAVQSPVATGMNPSPDPALVQAVASAVMQSDSFVQLLQQQQQMMQTLQTLQQSLAPPVMPGMGGQQPGMGQQPPGMMGQQPGGDPMQALLAQLMGGMGQQPGQEGPPQEEQRDDKDKVRLDANQPGMSFPSGSNTFLPRMPSAHTGDRDQTRSPRPTMYQQQPGQTAPLLPTPGQPVPQPTPTPALQQPPRETDGEMIARLTRERDAAIHLCRQMQVIVELTALQQEGIDLDVREEVPFLTGLADNDRALRYQHMRQRYRRRNEQQGRDTNALHNLPGLPNIVGTGPAVPVQYQRSDNTQPGGAEAPPTEQEHQAVINLMVEEKQAGRDPSYRVCLSRVRAGGNRNGRTYEQVY